MDVYTQAHSSGEIFDAIGLNAKDQGWSCEEHVHAIVLKENIIVWFRKL